MGADAGDDFIKILYNNSMWTSRVPELIDENELDNVDEGMLEYEDDFDYEFAERNAQEYPCDDYDYQFNAKENRAIAELIKKEPK